jgi:hypothetical protein
MNTAYPIIEYKLDLVQAIFCTHQPLTVWQGVLTSLAPFGAAIGSLLSIIILKKLSRRESFMYADFFAIAVCIC